MKRLEGHTRKEAEGSELPREIVKPLLPLHDMTKSCKFISKLFPLQNGILTFHAKYLEFVNEEGSIVYVCSTHFLNPSMLYIYTTDPSLPEVLQLKIHACGHTKSFLLETELTDDRLHVISDDIKHIPITVTIVIH